MRLHCHLLMTSKDNADKQDKKQRSSQWNINSHPEEPDPQRLRQTGKASYAAELRKPNPDTVIPVAWHGRESEKSREDEKRGNHSPKDYPEGAPACRNSGCAGLRRPLSRLNEGNWKLGPALFAVVHLIVVFPPAIGALLHVMPSAANAKRQRPEPAATDARVGTGLIGLLRSAARHCWANSFSS
jgi:hypothetical protein